MNKREIAVELKQIQFTKVVSEWNKLKSLKPEEIEDINGRSRLGCDFIDYYFFLNRLDTIGNKGINFFDFLKDIEKYKEKKYIQNLLEYCDKNNRYNDSLIKRYYYCYGLCFGRINGFKITNAMSIYYKFKPHTILDPFCGFGGRLVAAMILDINYIGIDINKHLNDGYNRLLSDFSHETNSKIQIIYEDSNLINYGGYVYDMVFTSPPYENIEIYQNSKVLTSVEWDIFYKSIFKKTWDGLCDNGIYVININDNIYNKILVKMFGECEEKIILKKSSKNSYQEYIYIWKKHKNIIECI